MIELPKDYGVNPVFNACDLTPYARLNTKDLRKDCFQEKGMIEDHLRDHMLGK